QLLRSGHVVADRVSTPVWASRIEAALAGGDARAAAKLLGERPGELLRRTDHLARVTIAKQPDALDDVLEAIRGAVSRGAPALLLQLAAHVSRRHAPWARRVMFPRGEVLKAWTMPDTRVPLRADLIGPVVGAVRAELVARAAARRNY